MRTPITTRAIVWVTIVAVVLTTAFGTSLSPTYAGGETPTPVVGNDNGNGPAPSEQTPVPADTSVPPTEVPATPVTVNNPTTTPVVVEKQPSVPAPVVIEVPSVTPSGTPGISQIQSPPSIEPEPSCDGWNIKIVNPGYYLQFRWEYHKDSDPIKGDWKPEKINTKGGITFHFQWYGGDWGQADYTWDITRGPECPPFVVATNTSVPTNTDVPPSATPSATNTNTPLPTNTPTVTPSNTPLPSATPTLTVTYTNTPQPPTSTYTFTPSSTPMPTNTQQPPVVEVQPSVVPSQPTVQPTQQVVDPQGQPDVVRMVTNWAMTQYRRLMVTEGGSSLLSETMELSKARPLGITFQMGKIVLPMESIEPNKDRVLNPGINAAGCWFRACVVHNDFARQLQNVQKGQLVRMGTTWYFVSDIAELDAHEVILAQAMDDQWHVLSCKTYDGKGKGLDMTLEQVNPTLQFILNWLSPNSL